MNNISQSHYAIVCRDQEQQGSAATNDKGRVIRVHNCNNLVHCVCMCILEREREREQVRGGKRKLSL